MANTINIPRTHLVMGLCLPLSVLLGYMLAEPLDSGSMAVVVFVLTVLSVPLLMTWYHPLLILSWNACIVPFFVPGQPPIWMMMAVLGLLFALLNRSVNPELRFLSVPSVSGSLVFLAAVVLITARLTGGIGLRALGGSHYGGKPYIYILAAITGYFALTSRRIGRERAGLYLAMFFLPALTGVFGELILAAGPAFYFLLAVFPPGTIRQQAPGWQGEIARMGGLSYASVAIYAYLLARYGLRSVASFAKPWRGILFWLAALGCVATGYRSALILFGLTVCALFYFEGLHRTRWLPISLGLVLAGAAVVLPLADRLPLAMQRSMAFLPAKVDPMVRDATDGSNKWRVDMWKLVLPDVPKYLVKGKGYEIDATDLYLVTRNGDADSFGQAMLAGNYHSGPLSVIIPFGIFGVIGFVWFLAASVKVLLHYYRFGDPALRQVNTFLLAYFIAKIVFFCCAFGGFWGDFFSFTGLIGLGVSMNGQPTERVAESEAEAALNELEGASWHSPS